MNRRQFSGAQTPADARSRTSRQRRPDATTTTGPNLAVGALAVFAAFAAVALAIALGIYATQNEGWKRRSRNDIQTLRNQEDSLGFMARKNGSQTIPPNVFTSLTDWAIDGTPVMYNTAGNAFDTTTGVWTTPLDGKYQVSTEACWTAGAFGIRQQVISIIPVVPGVVLLDTSLSFGVVCTGMSMTLDLTQGTQIELLVQRNSAGAETISPASYFSIERLTAEME